jgi:hypothetical protein
MGSCISLRVDRSLTLGKIEHILSASSPTRFPGFRNPAYPSPFPPSHGFAIYLSDLQLVDIHVLECPDLEPHTQTMSVLT